MMIYGEELGSFDEENCFHVLMLFVILESFG